MWRGNSYVAGKRKPSRLGRLGSNVANRRRVARGDEKFIAREKSFLCGKVRDIEHRKSLGNHEFLHEHAAVGDRVVHGEGGHRAVEEILAGLQIVRRFLRGTKLQTHMRLRTTPFSASRREIVRCDAPCGMST